MKNLTRRNWADIVYVQNMFNKLALLLVILVAIATNASSQAQEQTGTIQVTVQVNGTQTPLSGILVSLTPCPNCERDKLPETEGDLLAYLMALAKARGIPESAAYTNGVVPDPKPLQAAITNGTGILLFEKIKAGTYQIVARKPPFTGAPSEAVAVVITVDADNGARNAVLYLSAPPNK